MTTLFRKRLIPNECIHLKDDNIVHMDSDKIITKWDTLHPKDDFSHGISYYCIKEGWKISRFLKEDNSVAYIYCDIIDTFHNASDDSYIFTDLLADVIIENSGLVRVVDLDELAEACQTGIISDDMLVTALYRLNSLLDVIYSDQLNSYLDYLDQFQND